MAGRWILASAALAIALPAVGQAVRQLPPGTPANRPPSNDDRDAAKGSRIPPTVDAKYDAGMAAIRAKNPGAAVELMRPVLADFERRYADEKRQIYCAVTPEQSSAYLADAARAKRAAVAIDAGWCRAQYVTGYALIDLQRLPEAETAFTRLIGFAPQNSRYLNELGYILMKQKKWKESLDAYRRSEAAADLTPGRVTEERCLALKGIGYNLVELGDLDAAEAAYRKCLNINPQDSDSPRELEYIAQQRKLTV
ncbi:tetratricopeptide repeat protein [Sphingomonas sp.]|uniref:tetratricopeptide repeat protein n=1 Tax=Sphingomonas sp. TaxID=28214 RepID=UPI0025D1DE28|nr:tetratricopeptide repeat protein [Sphingomonas sp.]